MTCKMKDNRHDGRSAFTLIEMLFVIAIIAVLSSLAYGIMAEAQVDAQVSATKSRIAQIESIMQIVMEDYEVRRLPVRNAELLRFIDVNRINTPPNQVPRGVQLKNLRRRIMLDLVKSEFPREFYDATNNLATNPDLGVFPKNVPAVGTSPVMLSPPFDQSFNSWLRDNDPNYGYGNPITTASGDLLLADFLASRVTAEILFWRDFAASLATIDPLGNFKEPGEYLYVQMSRINIDGSTGLELLGPNAVGDPDGDGFLDIVDAFGESMSLRILQAEPDPTGTDFTRDLWSYVNTDWRQRANTSGLPVGYQVASSLVPTPISGVRIQVVSPRLEERGEY